MDGHTSTTRALVFTHDSSRLCSAGDDKSLEVWTRLAAGKAGARWAHERAIRWQVQRGKRGRIFALAAGEGVVALAGHGAMGALGEIVLVDPVSGELRRVLADTVKGHRQPVLSLSFGTSSSLLASQDVTGRAVLWRRDQQSGIWSPRELSAADAQRYGEQVAERLVPSRVAAPIVVAGNAYAIRPAYAEHVVANPSQKEGVPTWKLERIDLRTLNRELLEGATHYGMVTALAVTADGTRMASADRFGNLFVWNLAGTPRATQLRQDLPLTSLSFAKNGRLLAAGAGVSTKRNLTAAVQLWDVTDVANPRRISETPAPASVWSVAVSPDGATVAYTQHEAVEVRSTASLQAASQVLQGRARPVLRVAFSNEDSRYRIAFGVRRDASGAVPFERSFDLSSVRLEAFPRLREADWLSPSAARGIWSVRIVPSGGTETYWLYEGEKPAARLPLLPELHGRPTAPCWIAGSDGRPFAVAVGTTLEGNIYVYRLAAGGEAKVLRHFRGHEASVRSIGMSRDRRYLVSSADDATIRVWNLAGFDSLSESANRWGAEFEVRDGQLVVTSVRDDGPLYFRGVRPDDVIRSLMWPSHETRQAEVRESSVPRVMRERLESAGPDLQVVFDYRRRDSAQPAFQMFPAWQPLATLFVAENREWAFWTPAGYYDASFEGHKLFGWQVNRGLELLPEFFLAAQFQQALERPQVMDRLLTTGSLEAAFRAARELPPGNAQNAVGDQYRVKPQVTIVSPRPDESIAGGRTTIEATIRVRDGLQLAPPKAFANGVVATGRRLLGEAPVSGGREFRYAWDAALPSDARVVIQVVASTDAEVVDSQTVIVRHTPGSRSPARLYLVAAGVNQYRDPQIQKLDYAASNAQSIVDTFARRTRGLYGSEATMLVDNQVTRPMWNVVTAAYAERLRQEARPDDLLVFFLSGHGVRDEETSRYYFVSADARFDDVKAQRFGDCLSFEDFAAFSDVPCRKLVVLDTCHSGAIQQPLRQQDLKAALRALQTDVVFTLTASDGSQEAAEAKQRRLGRFTARLIEALEGAADQSDGQGRKDGIVTLQEAFQFVSAALASDSAGSDHVQHPTAGPIDLLDYSVLPLAGG
jgi:WD40 repeat protein